jgi:hypothetical protein
MSYHFKKIKKGIVNWKPEAKIYGIPVPCNAVLDLELPIGIPDKIYGECHAAHDDQLKVVEGSVIVLVLFNRQIHYIPLNTKSDLLIIPTGTWHSLVNINEDPARYQNWMIIKKPSTSKDYYPTLIKHKFNLDFALSCVSLDSPNSTQI